VSHVWRIASREYLENVRTKTFLIGIFLTPVLMGLSFLVPALLEHQRTEQRRIALLDVTGEIGPDVARRLTARTMPGDPEPLYAVEVVDLPGADAAAREAGVAAAREGLDGRVKDGSLFAWVVLRPSALERRPGEAPSEYRAGNLFDVKVIEQVRADLGDAVNERVVREGHVPRDAAAILTSKPPFDVADVRAEGRAASVATTVTPFVFTLLLYLTIVTVSQALVTSTIEEKGNRVIEVLLSSVSPFQLMTGKILGTCAVGLTLISIWAAGGLAGLAFQGIQVVTGGQLALCFALYILGFLLYASLMVAVGSACNTLKEAQNLLAPVMSLLTISLFFLIAVGREPQGTLARVLSLIPPFTPFLMMMRAAATPPAPAWETALALALLAASAWVAMRLAARVFRTGSLLYGKPPTLREIARWIRAK
jgi:ABC-2 type transport system permease protein